MPELPDVEVYVEQLARRVRGVALTGLRFTNTFVLRSVTPSPSTLVGRSATSVTRLGKRIVIGFEGDFFIVIHLMIAGRLHWLEPAGVAPKTALAIFSFASGTLWLGEVSKKKRASVHLAEGRAALAAFDRGGLEPRESTLETFRARLVSENHTLKRALTDPTLFSGIGNAYSDEILHAAKLSPLKLTGQLGDDEIARLHATTLDVLTEWTERLRRTCGDNFPEKVTAFRPDMAVHGRFGKPCPACGAPVQRIVYAENECNYCPRCQTGGRLLADRSLSRLMKDDWPKTLEALELKMPGRGKSATSHRRGR